MVYAAIDLKSFFASVECRKRNLNPLTTNLVVADNTRTEKTICLAISPSMKAYGLPGRARLFEVMQKVKNVNNGRRMLAHNKTFSGKSYNDIELKKDKNLELDYIIAPPHMASYMEYSTKIYNIYLKYISSEDIFPYSIDEVFCDLTNYINTYKLSPRELVTKIIKDIYDTTGITATAGIGTNLFLCKVAMDIVAKHVEPNSYGVRIAELDERSFREKLWNHKPITDFWRVGKGYAKRLEKYRMFTMGDVARCSVENEDLLYKIFGVNAELLIDHSWGWECETIKSVKECKPENRSLCSGQVLHCPYDYDQTKLIIKEMADEITLDMVEKHFVTDMLVLTIEYDIENLKNAKYSKFYNGEIKEDRYGRRVPKPAHGTFRLENKTFSTRIISNGFVQLFDRIINKNLLVRKIYLTVGNLTDENELKKVEKYEQVNLFTNYGELAKKEEEERIKLEKEHKIQSAIIGIKNKYGKNAIIKGMDLEESATTIQRNGQIGGHQE
jgi:hypothetical protein